MKKLLVNAATKEEKLSVLFHKSSDEAKEKKNDSPMICNELLSDRTLYPEIIYKRSGTIPTMFSALIRSIQSTHNSTSSYTW